MSIARTKHLLPALSCQLSRAKPTPGLFHSSESERDTQCTQCLLSHCMYVPQIVGVISSLVLAGHGGAYGRLVGRKSSRLSLLNHFRITSDAINASLAGLDLLRSSSRYSHIPDLRNPRINWEMCNLTKPRANFHKHVRQTIVPQRDDIVSVCNNHKKQTNHD